MSDTSRISKAVLKFLEDTLAELIKRDKRHNSSALLESTVDGVGVLFEKARSWPDSFEDMSDAAKKSTVSVSEYHKRNMEKSPDITEAFISKIFQDVKITVNEERDSFSNSGLEYGFDAVMGVVSVIAVICAAQEASKAGNSDDQAVVSAVASFLANLKFPTLLQHSPGLTLAISANLPAKLRL